MHALFIHGLNSDKHSSTGGTVKAILETEHITTCLHSFDVLNPAITVAEIDSFVEKNNIELIIGHSLGGFYTLASAHNCMKIYINPCCFNTAKLLQPLLQKKADIDLEAFERIEQAAIARLTSSVIAVSYGIFSEHDEVVSCYDGFNTVFGGRCALIQGGHRPVREHLESKLLSALDILQHSFKS